MPVHRRGHRVSATRVVGAVLEGGYRDRGADADAKASESPRTVQSSRRDTCLSIAADVAPVRSRAVAVSSSLSASGVRWDLSDLVPTPRRRARAGTTCSRVRASSPSAGAARSAAPAPRALRELLDELDRLDGGASPSSASTPRRASTPTRPTRRRTTSSRSRATAPPRSRTCSSSSSSSGSRSTTPRPTSCSRTRRSRRTRTACGSRARRSRTS